MANKSGANKSGANKFGSDGPKQGEEPITIKKYANRRLYNTAASSYITLDHLAHMIREGVEFIVLDAKTSEDITRSVLTHIIVEEEAKGRNMLPISFLRQLISLYGDSLQELVPRYLETSMQAFASNQEQMRNYMNEAMGGIKPFASFEEIGKQNMAFLENAMKIFSPFPVGGKANDDSPPPLPRLLLLALGREMRTPDPMIRFGNSEKNSIRCKNNLTS